MVAPFATAGGEDQGAATVAGDGQVVGIQTDAESRADGLAGQVECLPPALLDVPGVVVRADEDEQAVGGRPEGNGLRPSSAMSRSEFEPIRPRHPVEHDPSVARAGRGEELAMIGEGQPLGPLVTGRDPGDLGHPIRPRDDLELPASVQGEPRRAHANGEDRQEHDETRRTAPPGTFLALLLAKIDLGLGPGGESGRCSSDAGRSAGPSGRSRRWSWRFDPWPRGVRPG